jgi:hypothetical protein
VDKTGSALELRYALFFDFLGSKHAATTWPRRRQRKLIELLVWISQWQSAQTISGHSHEDGSYRFEIVPEVTTFSDNAVVSYPDGPRGLGGVWTGIVCQDAIRILSSVSEMALRIGLVVRGGLSFGELHQGSPDSGVSRATSTAG